MRHHSPSPLSRFAGFGRDLRHATRALRKSPGFFAMAVLTLALGIGANTATFSVVHGVLLAPLPYPEPERLVAAQELSRSGQPMASAWPNFVDWRDNAPSFAHLAAYTSGPSTILGGDRAVVRPVALVSQGFFATLGLAPVLGRAPASDEHRAGAVPVAVVSQGFFASELGGDRSALGHRQLELDGKRATVVGVMPTGFHFPGETDVWVPLEIYEPGPERTAHNFRVVGRLADGASLARAEEELAVVTARITAENPVDDYLPHGARVQPLAAQLTGAVRQPLWLLLGASLLVLLVACANLASAFLARGTGLRHDLAVRRALGASDGRLLSPLLAQGLVIAAAGAVLGLLAGAALVDSLSVLAASFLPRRQEIGLDGPVLAFSLGLALATTLLFALLPGWRLARETRLVTSGSRTSAPPARRAAWRLLVATQVALVLVLATGSALLVRSFFHVLGQAPGFDTEHTLTVALHLPTSRYDSGEKVAAYYAELLPALAALPGAQVAGVVNHLPLSGSDATGLLDVEGGPQPAVTAAYRVASPGYFQALGLPLVAGRLFGPEDRLGNTHVALVNQAFAALAWPGQEPLGKRLTGGGMDELWQSQTWATVVGVVGDVRHRGLTQAPEPEAYFSVAQRPRSATDAFVVIRSASSPAAVAGAARQAFARADDQVPIETATMDEVLSRSLTDRRFALVLLSLFALLGLLLAGVGIYGVVAYTVAQRRRELGIRAALGAEAGGVRRLVVGQAMTTVAIGLAIGTAATFALSRLLASLLYEVAPTDPSAFVLALALLAGAAFLASYLPARSATRIDPMEVLRSE